MRTIDNILWVLVILIICILFSLGAHSVKSQELPHDAPAGVTFKDGTYYVQRHVLKRFRRSQIKEYKALAKEYGIKYQIVR